MTTATSQKVWHKNYIPMFMEVYSEKNTISTKSVIQNEVKTSVESMNFSTNNNFESINSPKSNQELANKSIPVFGAIEFFALSGNAF